ncbi:hypothetical protein niasHT_008417 [Heterodera trifolii]|uniref:DNA-directed DNA polymerase n=1 Tax=Heterodera trifolii TaxID=157864 RepID=A0ABD2LQK5_9BILA
MPVPLGALPGAFGLSVQDKEFFPHLANVEANYGRILQSLPPKADYLYGGMTPDRQRRFDQWYAAHHHQQFDLCEQLAAYCTNDTHILVEALVAFRTEFLAISDPLERHGCLDDEDDDEEEEEQNENDTAFEVLGGGIDITWEPMTIASASMRHFRLNHLKRDQLAIVPECGYDTTNTQSLIALKFLDWYAKKNGVSIQTAHSPGGEKKIRSIHCGRIHRCDRHRDRGQRLPLGTLTTTRVTVFSPKQSQQVLRIFGSVIINDQRSSDNDEMKATKPLRRQNYERTSGPPIRTEGLLTMERRVGGFFFPPDAAFYVCHYTLCNTSPHASRSMRTTECDGHREDDERVGSTRPALERRRRFSEAHVRRSSWSMKTHSQSAFPDEIGNKREQDRARAIHRVKCRRKNSESESQRRKMLTSTQQGQKDHRKTVQQFPFGAAPSTLHNPAGAEVQRSIDKLTDECILVTYAAGNEWVEEHRVPRNIACLSSRWTTSRRAPPLVASDLIGRRLRRAQNIGPSSTPTRTVCVSPYIYEA